MTTCSCAGCIAPVPPSTGCISSLLAAEVASDASAAASPSSFLPAMSASLSLSCGGRGLSGCPGIGDPSGIRPGDTCICPCCPPAACWFRFPGVVRERPMLLVFLCCYTALPTTAATSLVLSGIIVTLAGVRVHRIPIAFHNWAARGAVELMAMRAAGALGAKGPAELGGRNCKQYPPQLTELPET